MKTVFYGSGNKLRFQLKQIACFVFLVLCTFSITAQTYPVQLSTQLIPPYSGYLPDYADPSSEKLKIILQFNDFSKPQYDLKLKIEIKGNGFSLVTKQLFLPPPITLQPGIPLLISGVDLAPYLNSSNLDFVGINQSQYEQRMALPEGYYSICVKAYDYYSSSPIQVSNEACANAWFTLSDPPYLNLPFCSQAITPQTPQSIFFQWTPVNIGSPNSASSTEYEFALWEVRPDSTINPNQIVLSTAPIYSTTTTFAFINYGITEPPLNLYMKYVWRVRAVDLSGRDWFKNNGYSQICTFTYGNLGNVLGNTINLALTAQGVTHRMGQCSWNAQSIYTNYLLQVRKAGTTNWFDYPTTSTNEKVTNLEPNTDYECRVRGEGSNMTGNWSDIATFRTLSEPNYSCGDQTQLIDPLPPAPLPVTKAKPGLIVQTGQFEMAVTEIQSNGTPGWYKGKGQAKVFGLPISVEFTNIYIDDNNRHQQGIIQALTKGIKAWTQQWDVQFAEENAIYMNGTIDSVYINNNQLCISIQGHAQDSCFNTSNINQNVIVVRDGEGNQYTVQTIPPPPKVTGPSNYLQYSTDILEAGDSLEVVFEKSANQQFGFDKKEYVAWTTNYEVIKLKNNKKYFVPYKSVGENQNDKVYAAIHIIPFDPNKLSFKTTGGQICSSMPVSGNTNFYEVTIADNAQSVYAWYDGKKIGKVNVVSLKALTRKLVLVPVNNSTINSQTLNAIFKQANISFSVSIKNSFTYNLGNDGLEAADANLLSKYSSEMRSLRDAYRKYDSLYDKEAYYVFVVPNFSDPALKGYMVRGRALGFITSNASAKYLAHELAHGAFGLEHTFPSIAKSTSENLMDYKEGVDLSRAQWDEMQNRSFKINLFDEEEDGALTITHRQNLLDMLLELKKGYKTTSAVDIGKYSSIMSIDTTVLNGINYNYITTIAMPYVQTLGVVTPKQSNITTSSFNSSYPAQGPNKPCIDIDGKLKIFVPADRIENMKIFIKSSVQLNNMLLFVNGYRDLSSFDGSEMNGLLEVKNSNNTVNQADLFNYWNGIDEKFTQRIGTRNTVYADGHHSVSTSNHGSVPNFLKAMLASDFIRNKCDENPSYEFCSALKCDAPEKVNYIHISPSNTTGFEIRRANGRKAGDDMVTKINNGIFDFNKTSDVLDIVAHSMGYAYSLGMIEKLKAAGIKLGRFYIIAPENAGAGAPVFEDFQEVWQYGSNLNESGNDLMYLQDGVAPQVMIPGITSLPIQIGGRVFIPNTVTTKGFVGSHSISNYTWIFNIPNIQNEQGKGYVKARN